MARRIAKLANEPSMVLRSSSPSRRSATTNLTNNSNGTLSRFAQQNNIVTQAQQHQNGNQQNNSTIICDDDGNLISGGILVVVMTFFVSIFSFYTYNRLTHNPSALSSSLPSSPLGGGREPLIYSTIDGDSVDTKYSPGINDKYKDFRVYEKDSQEESKKKLNLSILLQPFINLRQFLTISWPLLKAILARFFSLIVFCFIIFIIYKCIKYYLNSCHKEREQVYDLVDKTIELLQSPDTPRIMPVLHIRDTLMSPCERRTPKMLRLWSKCVAFIEENESRVKVELLNIDGEDFRAWKWVGSSTNTPSNTSKVQDINPNSTFNHNQSAGQFMNDSPMTRLLSSSTNDSDTPYGKLREKLISTPITTATGETRVTSSTPISNLKYYGKPKNTCGIGDNESIDHQSGGGVGSVNLLKTGDIEWQGSAFDNDGFSSTMNSSSNLNSNTQNNQIYDRMKNHTKYLKIRNMFDLKTRIAFPKTWKSNVRDAILEKCIDQKSGNHGITHMVIDETSTDGVVFAKCDSEKSARQAYCNLHGWWCEKKLVSVKFLKPERYYQRFPEAKFCDTQLKFKS